MVSTFDDIGLERVVTLLPQQTTVEICVNMTTGYWTACGALFILGGPAEGDGSPEIDHVTSINAFTDFAQGWVKN
jgi:hypothetical protein